jgi:Helix-hairpin-helix motif
MKKARRKPREPLHWTVQLPWLVAFCGIVGAGVLKFDDGLLPSAFYVAEAEAYGLMDLNTASQADLETLPKIGPALAERIIAARPYAEVGDLKRVPGIGPILMSRLLPKVVVKGSPQSKKAGPLHK